MKPLLLKLKMKHMNHDSIVIILDYIAIISFKMNKIRKRKRLYPSKFQIQKGFATKFFKDL